MSRDVNRALDSNDVLRSKPAPRAEFRPETREIREMGYTGAYTAVKRYLAAIRPEHDPKPYEVRFETKAGVRP